MTDNRTDAADARKDIFRRHPDTDDVSTDDVLNDISDQNTNCNITEKNVTDMNMNDAREQITGEECGAFMEQDALLDELLKEIAQQDAQVIAPLEAQAAWRKAIRAEAAAQNERAEKDSKKNAGGIIRLNRWMRSAGSIAAALVVLIAGTYGMRMGENAPVSSKNEDDIGAYSLNVQNVQTESYGAESYNGRGADISDSGYMPLASTYLRSDGSSNTNGAQNGQNSQAEDTSLQGTTAENDEKGAVVTSDTVTGDAVAKIEPVVLRSAERSIHSMEYDRDVQWLGDLIIEYDAYYEEKSEIIAEDEQTGRVSSMVIRVPSDRLDDFLMEMDQLATTVMIREKAEDVTGRYMDNQSRLKALQAQKDKLTEMMNTAKDVQELIAIDAQFTEVISEMERIEGDLRRWQSQQSYSTVSVTLKEVFEQTLTAEASIGERIKAGFSESMTWLGDFLQDAVVVLVSTLPRLVVWVPAAVLAGIVIWAIMRKKNR